jgi:hypothetical protein
MPRRHLTTLFALCLLASCAGSSGQVESVEPIANPSLAEFQQDLAPYGRWVERPGTGPVWQPANVPAGWEPYTVGRWEQTDQGWLWVSGEPWGRIVFHYGRWGLDASLGWFWVPGNEWAPAWVTWRTGDDLVGWAPLGPGTGPDWDAGGISPTWWTFVPARRFGAGPVRPHIFPRTDSPQYLARSRPVPPPTPRVAPTARGPAPAPVPTARPTPPPVRPPEGTGRGAEPVERGPGQFQRGGSQPVYRPRGGAGRGAREEPRGGREGAAQAPAPAPAAPAPAPTPDGRVR